MGADFISAILVIDENTSPNWTAASEAIRAATTEQLKTCLDDVGELDEDEEYTHESLVEIFEDAMNECKDAIDGSSTSSYYIIRGAVVYITGDTSWGDFPDTTRAFCIFSSSPGYQAAGFEV